jgi:hypothetical protein
VGITGSMSVRFVSTMGNFFFNVVKELRRTCNMHLPQEGDCGHVHIHGFSLILPDMFQCVRHSIVLSPLVPLSYILFVVDNYAGLLHRNRDFRNSPKTLPLVPYPICKPTCFCTVNANIILTIGRSHSNDYFKFVVITRNPLRAIKFSHVSAVCSCWNITCKLQQKLQCV